jgi:hypothetical protein
LRVHAFRPKGTSTTRWVIDFDRPCYKPAGACPLQHFTVLTDEQMVMDALAMAGGDMASSSDLPEHPG